MSKKKKQGKSKLVETTNKTTKSKVVVTTKKDKLQPTKSKNPFRKSKNPFQNEGTGEVELLFGKKNFMLILAGIALIALGMLLMAGGGMPSRDIWDESIIYGFRRITLAPISILLGLAVVLYSIFVPANNNV